MDREKGGSITARRLKEIASLKRKKGRREHGETIVEGTRSVQSLIESSAEVREIIVNHQFDVDAHRWLPRAHPPHVIANRQFEQLSDVRSSQGIIAVAPIRYARMPEANSSLRIVALDGLGDPGNAGAILRSAAWFGIDLVLCGAGTVDLFNPKVVRSAMGGIWDVDVVETEDLRETLRNLKQGGYEIYVADMVGSSVNSWTPRESGVLIIGSEAQGVSADVRAEATTVVSIPRGGSGRSVESLNAAISCAILLQRWCTHA